MPIRPQHRWLYPIDWRELSRMIRFERAKGCCEHCRRPHGKTVYHLGDGRWWDQDSLIWRNGTGRVLKLFADAPYPVRPGIRTTRVVLATAHLDHDPTNNSQRNLKALCQRCHICPIIVAYHREAGRESTA